MSTPVDVFCVGVFFSSLVTRLLKNTRRVSRRENKKKRHPPKSNILLWLTDRTDCTDSFAHATCFSTTEMTDLTDFVSIACSLRH